MLQPFVRSAVQRLVGQNGRLLIRNVKHNSNGGATTACFDVTESKVPELKGHFPKAPLLPAVLSLEALVQTAAVRLASKNDRPLEIVKVTKAKFRKAIAPPRYLLVHVGDCGQDEKSFVFWGKITSNDDTVAEAEFAMRFLNSS